MTRRPPTRKRPTSTRPTLRTRRPPTTPRLESTRRLLTPPKTTARNSRTTNGGPYSPRSAQRVRSPSSEEPRSGTEPQAGAEPREGHRRGTAAPVRQGHQDPRRLHPLQGTLGRVPQGPRPPADPRARRRGGGDPSGAVQRPRR